MSNPNDRRKFIKQALSGVAGCSFPFTHLSGEEKQAGTKANKSGEPDVNEKLIPIIDTHQHLWDLDHLNLPWLEGNIESPINRNFLMKDYFNATKGLNVVKTVYMEVDVHPSDQMKEAEYVIDLCKREDNPMAGAVIGGEPDQPDFAKTARHFSKNRYIKGFRSVLNSSETAKKYFENKDVVRNFQLLGELGLRFDLCLGPRDLPYAVDWVKQCPETQFVLDHCGNLSVQSTDSKERKIWEDSLKQLAGQENIICKISGIVASAQENWKPEDLALNINQCLDTFGEDRVMFAGDWPVCTLKACFQDWVNALKWIVKDRSDSFKKKLFHDNAMKFYNLS